MEKRYLTWDNYSEYMSDINNQINFDEINLIVAITRGGLIAGVNLSAANNKKLIPLTCSFRDFPDEEKYIKDLEEIKKYDNILIVDDIYDSGKTINKIKKDLSGKSIKFYTIYTTDKNAVDFYNVYKDFEDWIVFPWEQIKGEKDD